MYGVGMKQRRCWYAEVMWGRRGSQASEYLYLDLHLFFICICKNILDESEQVEVCRTCLAEVGWGWRGSQAAQEKGGPFELFVFVFIFIFVIVFVCVSVFIFLIYESRWRYAKVVWGWSSGGEGGPFEAISMILGQVALPLTSLTPKFFGEGFPELQPLLTCD